MMEQVYINLFREHLGRFEREVLNQHGYKLYHEELEEEIVSTEIRNDAIKTRLHLKIYAFKNGRKGLGLLMFKYVPSVLHRQDWMYFSLREFIERHHVKDLSYDCPTNKEFKDFIPEFFASLTKACQTYLKDQISGVSFEEHDPYQGMK